MKRYSLNVSKHHGELIMARTPKESPLVAFSRQRVGIHLVCLVCFLLIGCNTESTPKASHFEHDHEVAAHWPSDLADLSAKLRLRVASVRDGMDAVEFDQVHGHDHSDEDPHDHDAGHEGHENDHDDEHGHDEHGHDEHGHDEHGHDEHGHDEHGHDEHGHDEHGHEVVPLNEQISNLVGWVGEVSADTDLAEADWVPLYEKSESLAQILGGFDDQLPDSVLADIDALCELIDASVDKISEQSQASGGTQS